MRSLLPFSAALFVLLAFGAATAVRPPEARGKASSFERRVIHILNVARAHHGVPRLKVDRRLGRVARMHSADLAQRGLLAHESSDGTPMARRVRRFVDARVVGETIAAIRQRRGAASTAVRLWLASPPHRAIILSRAFASIGIGHRTGAVGRAPALVITADFASR